VKPRPVQRDPDDGSILPRQLVDHAGRTRAEISAMANARHPCSEACGIVDWQVRRQMQSASERGYGIPESDALSRMRRNHAERATKN
jgi:hypothetical protein